MAGRGEEAARSAYGALHTYTIGFATLEASRAGAALGSEDTSNEDAGSLGRQLAAYTTTGQFVMGLHYLLRGISSRAETARLAAGEDGNER